MLQQQSESLCPKDLQSWETLESINRRIARPLGVLRVDPPISGSDWAEEYFYLSAESSAVEQRWKTIPYQKAILNAACNDDIPELTCMKSTRIGWTKILLIASLYFIKKKRSIGTWQPTDTDSKRFVKVEVDPAIRDCPVVRNLFLTDPDKRNSGNTLDYKGFLSAAWNFRGGTSAGNFRAMTLDVGEYDEVDGHPINVDNEGSGIELGDQRLAASPFPKSLRGSTPKLKYTSQIEALFDGADLRFYRHLPCPHCFHSQRLVWANVKWSNRDYSTATYECEACKEHVHYEDYAEMDACGVWRTIDGKHFCGDDGRVRNTDGDIVDVVHIAFFVWGAYSYFLTWPKMVRLFLLAKESHRKTGDTTKLQVFSNTVLAETWEENQGDQPSWEVLRGRAEPYSMWTIPMGGLLLVASADTQNDRLEFLLEAYGRGEERWIIGHAVLMGDPFSQEPWDELNEWLARSYKHESGAEMTIVDCGIDSGGQRTQAVYSYVRKSPYKVYALKGMSTAGKPVIGRPTPQDVTYGGSVHKSGVKLWPVGSDTAKAVTYGRFKIQEHGPGYYHTPIGLPDTFYEQATAERLVVRMVKGFPVTEWHCNMRNEITDLNAYGYATAVKNGLLRLNWDKREEKLQLESETATFRSNTETLDKKPSLNRAQIKSSDPYM